eukprot:SAG31_NODE_4509_length_3178_cov_13.049367_4_plen_125_part_00
MWTHQTGEASTETVGRTLIRLEQRLKAENVELMRALAEEDSRTHRAQRSIEDMSQAITNMEAELSDLESRKCPICNTSVPNDAMDEHMGRCIAELKSWVAASVSERLVQECERLARDSAQEATR